MEFKTVLNNFTLFARLLGNSKTGNGLMISVIPNGGFDLETVRSKGSKACGDCPHAKATGLTKAGKPRKMGTCYVYKRAGGGQGALGGINNGFHRCDTISLIEFAKRVQVLSEVSGFLRIGEFGDVGADKQTAETIADIIKSVDPEVIRAGYTHQWKKAKAKNLKGLVMASVESLEDEKKAQKLGWKTFRVVPKGEEITGLHCPAQATKSMKCNDCGKCDGLSNNVQITLH